MDGADKATEINNHIIDCLSNPVRLQLYLAILNGSCSKASEIHRMHPEIPRATMYRHLNRLVDQGLITVVDEIRKRGSVERTYVATQPSNFPGEISDPNQQFFSMFIQYILGFVGLFHDYCTRPDVDVLKDRTGFSMAPVYATDDELDHAVNKIGEVIQDLISAGPGEGRRLHTLGLIISPPSSDQL